MKRIGEFMKKTSMYANSKVVKTVAFVLMLLMVFTCVNIIDIKDAIAEVREESDETEYKPEHVKELEKERSETDTVF